MVNPKVTFNCPMKWETMKVGLISRHCENCQRDVQDFTLMAKDEVIQFLLAHRNSKVCGRIKKSQLDYKYDEMLVVINAYLEKNKNSNFAFYLLTIGTLMLTSCSYNDNRLTKLDSAIHLTNETSAAEIDVKCSNDTLGIEDIILGDIMIDYQSDSTEQSDGIRIFAEVMPEFVGGIGALMKYINESIKYPDFEKDNKIEGRVFVSFTIDIDGSIVNPKIVSSVQGSKNFDIEVLRVISSMPKWKPGKEHGELVAVQYTLPIMFKL